MLSAHFALICEKCLEELNNAWRFRCQVRNVESYFQKSAFQAERRQWLELQEVIDPDKFSATNVAQPIAPICKRKKKIDESNFTLYDNISFFLPPNYTNMSWSGHKVADEKPLTSIIDELSIDKEKSDIVKIIDKEEKNEIDEKLLIKTEEWTEVLTLQEKSDIENDETKDVPTNDISDITTKDVPTKKVKKSRKKQCHICFKIFIENVSFQKHMTVMHYDAPKSDEYKCEICTRSFVRKNHYMKHMVKSHSGRIQEEAKSVFSNKVTFHCEICLKIFSSKYSYQCHVKTQHEFVDEKDKYVCDQCGKSFVIKHPLLGHIKKMHLNIRRTK